MADLIDRDKLLKSMGLTDAVKYGNKDAEQQYRSYSTWMSYEIADAIQDSPAVNSWISVEDALPEIDKDVLVYAVRKDGLGDAVTTITQYINHIWFGHRIDTEPHWKDPWQYFHSDYEITHWMPLPEPPERGTENGTT